MRTSLAFVVVGLLVTGPTVNSESLTVSKVNFPVDLGDRAFCVGLPEDGKLIAFQFARADGFGEREIWLAHFENLIVSGSRHWKSGDNSLVSGKSPPAPDVE